MGPRFGMSEMVQPRGIALSSSLTILKKGSQLCCSIAKNTRLAQW